MQISVGTKIALKFAGGAAFTATGVVCGILARADAALFAPLLAGLLFGVLGDFLLAAKNVREKRYEKRAAGRPRRSASRCGARAQTAACRVLLRVRQSAGKAWAA